MAPPLWKVVLIFSEDSEFSSRLFHSKTCPCRYCWCNQSISKWLPKLDLAAFWNSVSHKAPKPSEPPAWKLVLTFADGSHFSSRPLKSDSCACRYCWCGRHGIEQLRVSDLWTFQKFFSPEAAKSVEQLFDGCKSNCTWGTRKKDSYSVDLNSSIPMTRARAKLSCREPTTSMKEFEHPRAVGLMTPRRSPTSDIENQPTVSKKPARRQSERISGKRVSYNFPEFFDSDSDEDKERVMDCSKDPTWTSTAIAKESQGPRNKRF